MKLAFLKRRRSAGPDFKAKAASKNGIISCIFGIVAIALFAAASSISADYSGNAGEPVGFLGISSAMLCVVGLFYGGDGMKEREVSYVLPVTGTAVNGLLLVYLFWLYIYGLI